MVASSFLGVTMQSQPREAVGHGGLGAAEVHRLCHQRDPQAEPSCSRRISNCTQDPWAECKWGLGLLLKSPAKLWAHWHSVPTSQWPAGSQEGRRGVLTCPTLIFQHILTQQGISCLLCLLLVGLPDPKRLECYLQYLWYPRCSRSLYQQGWI